MTTALTLPLFRARRSAFTLVEVVIALGICASVMIALLGLLPMSLDQMRDARNMTTVARISEDIINDIQLMQWDELERLDGEKREYDDQGTKVEDVAGNQYLKVYTAEIEVDVEGIILPGSSDERSDFAKRVNIYIMPTKGKNYNLRSIAETDDRVKTFSTVIARLTEQKDPNDK